MIIDFKYHLTTLVAVFLALAIGIVAGSVMLGNDTIVWQQEQLTESITGELRYLQQENKQLKQKTDNLERYIHKQAELEQALVAEFANERLSGLQIAVIDTTDSGLTGQIVQQLKLAGASIGTVTIIKQDLGLDQQVPQTDELIEYLGLEGKPPEAIAVQLAKQVARGVHPGDNHAVLNLLTAKGWITQSGETAIPVQAVLLLGGKNKVGQGASTARYIDKPIIELLKQAGVKVYGAEALGTVSSYMPIYQAYQLGTVDNVDTLPGLLALIVTMGEGKQGNYGVKGTAKALLPRSSWQTN